MQLRKITNSMEMSLYQREVMGINDIAKDCLNLTLEQLDGSKNGKVVILVPLGSAEKLQELLSPLGDIEVNIATYLRAESSEGFEISKRNVDGYGPIKHLYGFI